MITLFRHPDCERCARMARLHHRLDSLKRRRCSLPLPIAYAPQRGREGVARYLIAAMRVFFNPSFHCVRKIVGTSDGIYEFESMIDGVMVNALDVIAWNGEGRVVEFKVMVRPLKAIHLTQERMAAMLESGPARVGTWPSDRCPPH